MKHLNIAVTDELWESMKLASIEKRRSVSDLVRSTLRITFVKPSSPSPELVYGPDSEITSDGRIVSKRKIKNELPKLVDRR